MDGQLDPERPHGAQVPDHGVLRLARVLPRVNADVELCTRVRRDRVERVVDARRVDADHGDRGPRPDAGAEGPGADERDPGGDLGKLAELRLVRAAAGPLLAEQPLDRDVAVGVVKRRERVEERDSASGAAPPNDPLCLAEASVRTSTSTFAMPRSATERVGMPGCTLPRSATIMTSAANRSGAWRG